MTFKHTAQMEVTAALTIAVRFERPYLALQKYQVRLGYVNESWSLFREFEEKVPDILRDTE